MQQSNDDSNPNEIIPISFNIYKILEDNRENFGKYNNHFSSEKILNSEHILKPKQVVQNSWKFMEYKKN